MGVEGRHRPGGDLEDRLEDRDRISHFVAACDEEARTEAEELDRFGSGASTIGVTLTTSGDVGSETSTSAIAFAVPGRRGKRHTAVADEISTLGLGTASLAAAVGIDGDVRVSGRVIDLAPGVGDEGARAGVEHTERATTTRARCRRHP